MEPRNSIWYFMFDMDTALELKKIILIPAAVPSTSQCAFCLFFFFFFFCENIKVTFKDKLYSAWLTLMWTTAVFTKGKCSVKLQRLQPPTPKVKTLYRYETTVVINCGKQFSCCSCSKPLMLWSVLGKAAFEASQAGRCLHPCETEALYCIECVLQILKVV